MNDCLTTTEYIFDHVDEFNLDVNRIALAGDSAGGMAVAVITQKFAKQKKYFPKLQILIYPWMQLYNFRLPSMLEYGSKHAVPSLTPVKLGLCYLGRTYLTHKMIKCLSENEHLGLIESDDLSHKYDSYVNVSLIKDEYRNSKSYYEKYAKHEKYPHKKIRENSILNKDLKFREDVLKLFNKDLSPLLADNDDLQNLPPAYFVILEWDMLKDGRLKIDFKY